jgi:integrase
MTSSLTLSPAEGLNQAAAIFSRLDVAESTREEYTMRISGFLNYLEGQPLTHESYLDYKRYLQKRGDLTVSTKNKYLVAARILLKELHRRGLLPVDLTANVRLLQQSKKHKRDGLDDDEMARFAAWLRGRELTATSARLKALVCLMALQGLRQIEVCRLDVADIDLVGRTVLVRGKGRDDKELFDLHPETARALKDYMRTARVGDGPLFPSTHRGDRYERLVPRTVRRLIRQPFDELGIDKTTHGFRHYFVTKLCVAYGGDLLTVSQYTRHNSLEMLQVYNDRHKQKEDLPNYYRVFEEVHV